MKQSLAPPRHDGEIASHTMFEKALDHALHEAEHTYDKVVRRWGSVPFAESTLYDWVWSEEFSLRFAELDERELGVLRILVLRRFQVKPWPWHPVFRRDAARER